MLSNKYSRGEHNKLLSIDEKILLTANFKQKKRKKIKRKNDLIQNIACVLMDITVLSYQRCS